MEEISNQYVQRLKTQLDEWDRQLDVVRAKARRVGGEALTEINDLVERALQREGEVRQLVSDLRDTARVEYKRAKERVGEASQELKEAIEKVNERFRQEFPEEPLPKHGSTPFEENARKGQEA